MIRLNEMWSLNLALSIFSVQTWGIAPKKSSEASNSSAIYLQSQLCYESILTFAMKSWGLTIQIRPLPQVPGCFWKNGIVSPVLAFRPNVNWTAFSDTKNADFRKESAKGGFWNADLSFSGGQTKTEVSNTIPCIIQRMPC